MSETTPGETPVERRLREMIAEWRDYADDLEAEGRTTRAEAWSDAATELEQQMGALLARCEGDR